MYFEIKLSKKFLLERRMDESLSIYSRVLAMTIFSELFSSDLMLWNQRK